MDEQIGIVRRCVRCMQWEGIDNYDAHARVCKPCMRSPDARRIGKASRIRTLRITQAGRDLLAQWRTEETPVA